MSHSELIIKNLSYISFSKIIYFIFGFLFLVGITRYLGSTDYGLISFFLAYLAIFAILLDFGFSSLLTRDIARNKSDANKYLSNIFAIKIILTIIFYLILIISSYFLLKSLLLLELLLLLSVYIVLSNFIKFFYSLMQAFEKMEYQSFLDVLNAVLLLGGLVLAIIFKTSLFVVVLIYPLSAIILFFISWYFVRFKFVKFTIRIDLKFWLYIFKESLPFWLITLFYSIRLNIGLLFLSFFTNYSSVGLFNASLQIINILIMIPSILNIVMYPALSKFFVNSKENLVISLQKYFKISVILGLPISFGLTFLSDKIVYFLFGIQYMNSSIILKILSWQLLFIFLGGVYTRLLEAANKQKVIAILSCFVTIEYIIMCFFLIPIYGGVGLAITNVIAEGSALILVFLISIKNNFGFGSYYSKIIIKSLVSCFLMSFFIISFYNLNLFLLIGISVIMYFFFIILLKILDENDKIIIYNFLNSLIRKFSHNS